MRDLENARRLHYRGLDVLVTGADGFIGSHLTEALVARGAGVTALSLYNSFDSFGWLDDLPMEVRSNVMAVRGDIRDAAFVRRLVAGRDIVFHLAALIAIPHSYVAAQSYVETNVIGTLNVLEAARDTGVQRIVHTSTSEVYGTAISLPISEWHPLHGQSPYSASKIGADMMAEAFARSFGLPVVILRPFNTFGPRQSERAIIPSIMRQALDTSAKTIRIGDTTPIRDFTYVSDTVEAFLAAGLSQSLEFGRPYNAGSGKAVTIGEITGLILDLTGGGKTVESDPLRVRPANSEVRALLADSALFRSHTGWTPGIALRDGIARTIEWWRERLARGRVRSDTTYVT